MVAVAASPSGDRSPGRVARRTYGRTFRLTIIALLGLALVLAGGASRSDEIQQVVVRTAAIAAIAASLWPLEFDWLRTHSRWVLAVAALYALMLIQLVPLPPAMWAQLPGHGIYARIAEQAGAVGWRPLSLTPDLTLNSLFGLIPATAAGLAALFLDSRGRWRLAKWVVAAACFSGLLGLIQLGAGGNALRFFRESSADSAVGVFANRNHQAAFLACALPLTGALAGLRLRPNRDAWAVAALASLVAFLVLALVATGSRMGLVLGVTGVIGAIWCFRASGQPAMRISARALMGAGLVMFVLLAAIAYVAVRIKLVDRLLLTDTASETRSELLVPLFQTAQAFMPWGSGFGSFDSVFRQFEPNELLSTIHMNQAHNEPLQLAIEGGLPALALVGLFLWWWVGMAARVLRADLPSGRRAMAIAAVVIIFILLASSLVDYPLRTPLLGAVFAISCVEMMRTGAARRTPSSEAPNAAIVPD